MKPTFNFNLLTLNYNEEIEKITLKIKEQLSNNLHKRGIVLGLSGGIDSSVVAALCIKSLGAERVLGILMPEEESAEESTNLGLLLAEHYKMPHIIENITPILKGAKCYERRNEAIQKIIPKFNENWKCKIVLPSLIDTDKLRFFTLIVMSPNGDIQSIRMPTEIYLTVVAASNFKQRTRKMIEYFHADRLNYAVAGTPNRLEYDQGFFVKNGDGAADLKPIAHLYKTQVYMIAEYLNIPLEIRQSQPTTDTYSLPQSQEEFYFSLPYEKMDLCLYAYTNGYTAENIAKELNLTTEQILRVYRDIESKRKTTKYQHLAPLLIEDIL